MRVSSASSAPVFQEMTVVVTALTPDARGNYSHVVVTDTTSAEVVEIGYMFVSSSRR